MKISDMLFLGQSNAVPLRKLCTMIDIDGRTIRRMVERERRTGVPILPDNTTGYSLADSPEEIKRFVFAMRGRANEILATAAAVEQCIEK